MAADPENSAGKQRGRPFERGVSGNPGGKPKGARHRATQLAERLMQGELAAVVNTVTSAAIAGDMTACRLVLERLMPVRKGRPIALQMPPIKTAGDAVVALAAITEAVGAGKLTPEEAGILAGLAETGARLVAVADLESRVAALERATDQQGSDRR